MSTNRRYADTLGKRLRKIRTVRSIGLRELARLAEISPSYLCEIENGDSVPTVDKVQRLAKVLRISLAKLLPAA